MSDSPVSSNNGSVASSKIKSILKNPVNPVHFPPATFFPSFLL
jgi:hypothetical protein